jgi:hypothetical protein
MCLNIAGGCADWVMVLPKRYAKQMKDAVKRAGWLDQSRKGGELSAGNVGLPLLRAGAEALSGAVSDQDSVPAALVRRLVAETGSELQQMALSNAKRVQSPAKRLREVPLPPHFHSSCSFHLFVCGDFRLNVRVYGLPFGGK